MRWLRPSCSLTVETIVVSAAAFTGTGRHRAPYWNLRHLGQAGVIAGLAAAVPAAFLWSGGGKARVPAPPAAQVVAAAGIATRPAWPLARQVTAARQVVIQTTYRVRRDDSLSAIAATQLGSSKLWPELWWLNRHQIANPAMVATGTSLKLVPLPPLRERYEDAALAAIPPPPAPLPAAWQAPAGAGSVAAIQPAPASNVSTAGMGSYQACVIARESGGNPSAVNASSGAGGLYQFLPSTWAGLGYSGLPQNASVAQQTQAFDTLYAQQGSSPWVSDGC